MKEKVKTPYPGPLTYVLGIDKLFWLLLIVSAVIPILYFSYVPIWDGWQFSRCYMMSATKGTLDCFKHSAILHTFLFSLTQRIDLGNFRLIYTLNLLFWILGLVSFRSLVQYLFGSRLSPANLTLLAFCFGLNPVFLVQIIQPSLDFTLPILLVVVLLFLFKSRFVYAALAGVLMVFTKESGFMLYGVGVFLFIPLMIFNDPALLKDKKSFVKKIGVLFIPIVSFVAYMVIVPHTQIGNSWTEGILKMLRFYLLDKIIAAQLVSLLVINFNWVITAIVLINVIVMCAAYLKSPDHNAGARTVFSDKYEGVYFYVSFVAIIYFLTRIPFVNNPRYMLPALPILIILLGASLARVLRKQPLITVTLTALLVLLTASSFRTVDPVSKKIMGMFKFGSHELLQMARFDPPIHGYERDQLVYNFEFTQFHYITEKIFRKVGWARYFVIPREVTWLPDFGSFDTETGHRAIYGDKVRSLSFSYSDEITSSNKIPYEIYYISYPNYDRNNMNANNRAQLSSLYDLKEIIPVENDGYSIEVYRYVSKND
ncbi:MAG: hypothetical protein ACHQ6U_06645 [Thermodesulfobacteriota bacterium]